MQTEEKNRILKGGGDERRGKNGEREKEGECELASWVAGREEAV